LRCWWYTTESALAEPRYRDRIPILIGGSGEKKTFSIAARYADHLNVIAGFDALPGKLDALAKRCDEAGRDRSTRETSILLTVLVDENARRTRSRPRQASACWWAASTTSLNRSRPRCWTRGSTA
jgi:alkanesulfonate monooxygenase SsuD/methylene tetrahydromethanopterin reductase-like flavin-dependent oxidoreductase (luciferase family)